MFVIKKVKNIALWTYVISNLNGDKKNFGTFDKKESLKTKRKCDKIYVT